MDPTGNAPLEPSDPAPDASRLPSGLAADDIDLRASLADLSTLTMNSGPDGLEDLLRHVAAFAVRAIPGADGAGLTLLENDRPDTIVASSEFVKEVDAIQYGLGQGPCITAAAEGRTVMSGSLQGEKRWPRFGPRVAQLGVHSVLSLPLMSSHGALGAMNVYGHTRDSFDQRSIELGELFAVPAAISVRNAQVLAQAKRVAAQLQSALTSRSVIDQALGIVMSRTGCSADEAFAKLVTMSQADNQKVSVIAQRLVADARRRGPLPAHQRLARERRRVLRVALPVLTPLDPGPDPPLALVPRDATCRAWTWHVARRSGRPEYPVELSDAVAADLAALTDALDGPGVDLAALVQQLGASCALAVGSYLGFSIIIVVGDVPVSFAVLEEFLDPSEILTSVRFPVSAVGEHAPGSEIVLYAATSGAFVDLAADLTHALKAGPDVVQLDQHLTAPDPALGAAGFLVACRQSQAIGILLDRGHDPEEVLTELGRLARFQAITMDAAAQQLIDSAVRPLRPELLEGEPPPSNAA